MDGPWLRRASRSGGGRSPWSFGILDASGGFSETHSGESITPFRVEALLEADIWCHGRISALGFQSHGEWDQDRTDWSVGSSDQFAAEDRHRLDFREDQMRISEDGIPNQALQATPGNAGLVVWSRGSGVPELGR